MFGSSEADVEDPAASAASLTTTLKNTASQSGHVKHFRRRPDQLTQDHLREYQAYLLRGRKLEPRTVKLHVSALRFFFVKTLKRAYLLDDLPYPKVPRLLPTILTVDEITRLIDAARGVEGHLH